MKTEYYINGQRRKGYILLKYCFLKILKFTDVCEDIRQTIGITTNH